jgi:DNA polymerase III epsilon subunit-like protein
VLARRKHPGGHNMLDDLCSRHCVNSLRSKHGALLDAELLAAVYVELTTTRQAALQLEQITRASSNIRTIVRTRLHPLPPCVTAVIATRIGRSCKRSGAKRFGAATLRAMKDRPMPPDRSFLFGRRSRNNFTSFRELKSKLSSRPSSSVIK